MLTGRLPYENIDDIDTLKIAMCALKRVSLPMEADRLPKPFKEALSALLQVHPEARPTIDQVLVILGEAATFASEPGQPVSDATLTNAISASRPATRLLSLPPPTPPALLDENMRIMLALLIVPLSAIIISCSSPPVRVGLCQRPSHVSKSASLWPIACCLCLHGRRAKDQPSTFSHAASCLIHCPAGSDAVFRTINSHLLTGCNARD